MANIANKESRCQFIQEIFSQLLIQTHPSIAQLVQRWKESEIHRSLKLNLTTEH